MNILVTGATGFIGGAVVKELLEKSLNITILIRNKSSFIIPFGVNYKIGDLRDYKSIEKALKNIDIVINCAGALPHHKLSDREYWDINSTGVQNVVKACLKNKVKRLIHISTVGIYEKQKSSYSLSKLKGEKNIRTSKLSKSSVILRPTICYGPGDMRPVFLKLFKMIKKGINISIGGGKNYFHTIYIDNLVHVIIKSIYKKSVLGEDFIVGDIKCPRMENITNNIIRVFGKPCVNIGISKSLAIFMGSILGIEKTIRFVSEDRKYNLDKLKKYFEIKSDITIDQGIKTTFKWYRDNNII